MLIPDCLWYAEKQPIGVSGELPTGTITRSAETG